jgi:hypothetical protein
MHWPAESAALIERMLRAAGEPALGIAAVCTSIVLFLALLALAGRHRRLQRKFSAQASSSERQVATSAAGLRNGLATPVDRVLSKSPWVFYLLVIAVSMSCWLLGLALAPSVRRFQESLEWHVQPAYLAAHLIAVRLFVRLFLRNYLAGALHLEMPTETIDSQLRSILGLRGGALAVAIAVPFCVLDYRYLVSDRYEKLSEDQTLHAIDYVMWGLWCAEWLVNAFIWVALAGFLALSYRALRVYRFRFPIAKVVQEKLYLPFLQICSQGSTIVLVFAGITGLYIWYAGGALSDFLGLGVTGLLLVVGFIPLWLLLNAKVRCAVAEEIGALRLHSSPPLALEKMLGGGARTPARSVEERLDELVALMHAWRLEHLQLDLGRTEAKALAVRLAVPAATAGWQLFSNLQGIVNSLGKSIGSILSMLAKLLT